ncbi:uncharacterized protein LTR77_000705 [Saxophila tyrrhenica]|uniref:Atos-like conserved domain-containing protein n=1 Tax=Saxophila tyrrhenica TaxID=1690608 RepID=A0AAV9PPA9_9PEZI|nr:hypothetical protein LTR77_000705 [Saxophila tyrrhenica]
MAVPSASHLGNDESGKLESNGDSRAGMSGPAPQTTASTIVNPYYTGRPRTPANGSSHAPIDRQEIIRRIKSRESRPTSPELERPASRTSLKKRKSESPEQDAGNTLVSRPKTPDSQAQDNHAIGQQIERPRSALHRGDFREKQQSVTAFERSGDAARDEPAPSLSTSPGAPWRPDFPSAAFRHATRPLQSPPDRPPVRPARTRAISNASLASSFIYKPPTSPLVQASRPDTPEPPERRSSRSPDKSRRHTFSPQSFQRFQSALEYPATARSGGSRQPPLRAERTFPYQAHQPRRSLNSFQTLPPTPGPGSRRPSFSDSPLQHAAMVGSYEESILRGRMSTTPSKPLNFVAQIGVLGKGDCKPNLRCPPHVTVPFPAVFYSYSSGATSTADQPSPYVGLVDLENNLSAITSSPDKRRQGLQGTRSSEGSRANSRTREENSASDAQAKLRRRQKQKRRSRSPKAPPGGSYRIPQQGQLQIVIKNPNKTAVKLFLVPYDLSDMEPGQKTFLRQRSYSAGPIIDMPLTSRKNFGTDRPEASLNTSDDPNDRPMLRYLIHLHICCPSKGRYFLYKSVRVVFANRVPDGKEKLRNEIQLPEPRYSAYKPGRESKAGLMATPKDNARRRSAIDPSIMSPDPNTSAWTHNRQLTAQSLPSTEYNPHFSFPSHVSTLPTLESRPPSRQWGEAMDVDAREQPYDKPHSSSTTPSSSALSPIKRLENPFNFERDHSRERPQGGRSESLLSRRLKEFALQAEASEDTF